MKLYFYLYSYLCLFSCATWQTAVRVRGTAAALGGVLSISRRDKSYEREAGGDCSPPSTPEYEALGQVSCQWTAS